MPEFPSDKDVGTKGVATKSDKAMTIGLVLAGIVVALILAGSVFNQTSQEHQVNQPSTESPISGDTKTP
jgi:uncharacterized membrane protein affecting hemolysin expression